MEWITHKEAVELFEKELGISKTTASNYLKTIFKDKIRKKHRGIVKFCYSKEDILKLIEKLRLLYE